MAYNALQVVPFLYLIIHLTIDCNHLRGLMQCYNKIQQAQTSRLYIVDLRPPIGFRPAVSFRGRPAWGGLVDQPWNSNPTISSTHRAVVYLVCDGYEPGRSPEDIVHCDPFQGSTKSPNSIMLVDWLLNWVGVRRLGHYRWGLLVRLVHGSTVRTQQVQLVKNSQ